MIYKYFYYTWKCLLSLYETMYNNNIYLSLYKKVYIMTINIMLYMKMYIVVTRGDV